MSIFDLPVVGGLLALMAIAALLVLSPFTGALDSTPGAPIVGEKAGRIVCARSFNAANAGGSYTGPVHVAHSLTGKACSVTGPGRGLWTTFDERRWTANPDGWVETRPPNADLKDGRLVLRGS